MFAKPKNVYWVYWSQFHGKMSLVMKRVDKISHTNQKIDCMVKEITYNAVMTDTTGRKKSGMRGWGVGVVEVNNCHD